jgi:hypothetical protein
VPYERNRFVALEHVREGHFRLAHETCCDDVGTSPTVAEPDHTGLLGAYVAFDTLESDVEWVAEIVLR